MYSRELQNKIIDYYKDYYKSCGLKDYAERARARLKEETLEKERMERLQEILGVKFNSSQKHFIFGAGTAGLAVVLKEEYGADVYGIEPSKEEFEIIQMKMKERGIDLSHFKKEYGENISFPSDYFDFVHCFTVLEHVQDVKKCISEMIRITKKGGMIYINTPNYAAFEERHYKIRFPFPPAYLPRFFSYLYLILRGRPYKFLKTITFLTEKRLNRVLNDFNNIVWLRIYISKKFRGFLRKSYPNQEVLIKKANAK